MTTFIAIIWHDNIISTTVRYYSILIEPKYVSKFIAYISMFLLKNSVINVAIWIIYLKYFYFLFSDII